MPASLNLPGAGYEATKCLAKRGRFKLISSCIVKAVQKLCEDYYFLNIRDPFMHYYRYRPASEISFKELLYDELYFCSPAECNDPFDSKAYYQFSEDIESWKRLVTFALGQTRNRPENSSDVDAIASVFARCSPFSFEDVMKREFFDSVSEHLPLNENRVSIFNAVYAVSLVIQRYRPSSANFVSFSRANNEVLMWSHYAANHAGFCLIFKSIDGKLSQCPVRARKSVSRSTPGGFAPQMSLGLPLDFPFEKVEYMPTVETLDAFKRFPSFVVGKELPEEERLKLAREQSEQLFHKHLGWSYEKEWRLSLKQPEAWLFGDHYDFSPNERLMHYEPTQLVGLIYGCRTTEANKGRLSEIVTERMDRIASSTDYPRTIFDFAIHQAELAPNAREVTIKPLEIVGLGAPLKADDADFPRKYSDWSEGRALRFAGGGCSKVKVES